MLRYLRMLCFVDAEPERLRSVLIICAIQARNSPASS
jgi:hypothetical protein